MKRVFAQLLAVAAALVLSVTVSIGTAVATTSTAVPSTATPSPEAAAAEQTQVCTATYSPADKEKVSGEPTEMVLTGYGCGDMSATGKLVVKAFEHRDYVGDAVELRLNNWNDDCDIDGFRWDSLPAGWNDRISSFRAYSTCQGVRLYEHSNTSGICGTYINDVTYVGDEMNDKASSARVSDRKKDC